MIEELIALIGEEAFIRFACVFGGRQHYIGATVEAESRLIVVVGKEAAAKIIKAYSGGSIYIPKHFAAGQMIRNKCIIQDFDAGLSIQTLSQKYELSDRQISYILKKPL